MNKSSGTEGRNPGAPGVVHNTQDDMEVLPRELDFNSSASSFNQQQSYSSKFPRLFWTPGTSFFNPIKQINRVETKQKELLATARKLSGKTVEPSSKFILPAPKKFSGNWDDDAYSWIERFQRHVSSFETTLLDEELLDYAGSFYTASASLWHTSASILYESWDDYVSAFCVEFNPEKYKSKAMKELKSISLYNSDLLNTYAVLKKLFKVLNILDEDEKVDWIFKKLKREDRKLMVNLGFTTFHQIMDCLRGRQERDKLYGSEQKTTSTPHKIIPKYTAPQKQCYNCRRLGHIARDCPNQGPPKEDVAKLKNELNKVSQKYQQAKRFLTRSVEIERQKDQVQHVHPNDTKEKDPVPVAKAKVAGNAVDIVIDT
ncbi:hypothetical protein BB558_004793, partial [Smittium angustum]